MLVKALACLFIANDASAVQDVGPESETRKLYESQLQLSERYQLLESKLLTLHEFERETNPLRSKLLKLAFLQSQEQMTASQLENVSKLLDQMKLKEAEQGQKQILVELKALLELLEGEDRGQRVRDDIRRHQEYLKEIGRLIRIQRGIRAQAEEDPDHKRLVESEMKIGDRAEKLANDINRNEKEEGPSQDIESSDEGTPTDTSEKNVVQGDNHDPNANPESGQGTQQQGELGQQTDEPQQPQQPDAQPNPVGKSVDAARKKMQEAQGNLEKAQRSESIEAMQAAERELEKAKQELEAILRQLREEEVERTLAVLEGRFRQMLEQEIRIRERTAELDQIQPSERKTEFEIQTGKLGTEQNSLATEASRALMLLRDDGSSVAFPETVAQMRDDMIQVSQRLTAANVGNITTEMQQEIIETLQYLIEALVTTQQDLENVQLDQQPRAEPGQAGDQALVDRLAEIKMLRGLQDRIYKRHQRYSKLLSDPSDPIGRANDLELQRALERLAAKQAQLTDIARDIVSGKNK